MAQVNGGQVIASNTYLDGSYTELFPHVTRDIKGMTHLFKYFSFPGGTASHALLLNVLDLYMKVVN
nr:hypothetical protein [Mycoplasmopsis bovis]